MLYFQSLTFSFYSSVFYFHLLPIIHQSIYYHHFVNSCQIFFLLNNYDYLTYNVFNKLCMYLGRIIVY